MFFQNGYITFVSINDRLLIQNQQSLLANILFAYIFSTPKTQKQESNIFVMITLVSQTHLKGSLQYGTFRYEQSRDKGFKDVPVTS